MKFVGVIDNGRTVTVDGYSNRKTKLGAVREMGRYIAQHLNGGEGECIMQYGLAALQRNTMDPDTYCLEIDEVPCACQYDEDTDTMEYDEGRWYIVCRFIK